MKWFTTTAVLLLVSTYASAKPIPSSTIPTACHGDWINISASKTRAQVCHEIRESSYSDVGKHYLLTFTTTVLNTATKTFIWKMFDLNSASKPPNAYKAKPTKPTKKRVRIWISPSNAGLNLIGNCKLMAACAPSI